MKKFAWMSAVAALALAGCGSGSSDETTTNQTDSDVSIDYSAAEAPTEESAAEDATESGLTIENAQMFWDCGHWYLISVTKIGFDNAELSKNYTDLAGLSFHSSSYITGKLGISDDIAKSQLNKNSDPYNNYSINTPGHSDITTIANKTSECKTLIENTSNNTKYPELRNALRYGIDQIKK